MREAMPGFEEDMLSRAGGAAQQTWGLANVCSVVIRREMFKVVVQGGSRSSRLEVDPE